MKSAKRLWCFCFAVFFQSFLFAGSYTVTSPADSGAGTLPTIMDQIRINSDPDPTIHFSPHFALSPANWTIDSKGYAIALPSVISGSGGLVKSDSSSLNGTLTLTGKNTYLGGTTITGGTLNIAGDEFLGSGGSITFAAAPGSATPILQAGGIIITFRNVTFQTDGTIDTNGNIIGVAGQLLGSGTLFKTDSGAGIGTLILSGVNSDFFGGVTIQSGTVNIASATALGTTGTLEFNAVASRSAILFSSSPYTISNPLIQLTTEGTISSSATPSPLTFMGALSGSGQLNLTGSGIVFLAGENTHFNGGIQFMNSGVVQIAESGALGTGPFVFNGGSKLQLSPTTTSAVTIGAPIALTLPGIIDTNGIDFPLNLAGPISGSGLLTKVSPGTLLLTGANSHTGGSEIRGGTLQISHANALGEDVLTFAATPVPGILQLSASVEETVTIRNPIQLTETAIFDTNGASHALHLAGTIQGTAPLFKISSGTLVISGTNTATGGVEIQNGTLNLASATGLGTGTLRFCKGGSGEVPVVQSSASDLIITGGIDLLTDGTLDTNGTTVMISTSPVSGPGALILTDSMANGHLVLTGSNTYTGGTILEAGTLRIESDSNVGSGEITFRARGSAVPVLQLARDVTSNRSITLASSGTFDPNGQVLTLNGDITGATLYLNDSQETPGTLVVSGQNAQSGTTIQNGTLQIASDAALGNGPLVFSRSGIKTVLQVPSALADTISTFVPIVLATEGTFDTNGMDNALVLGGVIEGSGALHKINPGTLQLASINTYTGGTTVSGGTLAVVGNGRLPLTGVVTLAPFASLDLSESSAHLISVGNLAGLGGTIHLGGNKLLAGDSTNQTYAGVILDGGSGAWFSKTGAGTLTFTGTNEYTGGTTIREGTLALSGSGSLPRSSTVVIASHAVFDVSAVSDSLTQIGDLEGNGTVNLGATALKFGGGTFTGLITGAGALIKTGPGTANLAHRANAYSGGTTIEEGTLQAMFDGALGAPAAPLTLGGGTYQAIGCMRSERPIVVQDSINGSTIDTNGLSLQCNGGISGSGALTKRGEGVLGISGTHSFKGPLTIEQGHFNLNGVISSSVSIAAGAIFSGNATVGPVVNHGLIRPGNSIGTITINGDLTLEESSLLQIEVSANSSGTILIDNIVVNGRVPQVAGAVQFNFDPSAHYPLTAEVPFLQAASIGEGSLTILPSTSTSQFRLRLLQTETAFRLAYELQRPFINISFDPNPARVAENIASLTQSGALVANSALLNLINSLTNQSSNDINASLNALHPALFSAYGEYQTETVGQIVLLLHRWPYKACEPFHPNHFWVELLGDWFSEKAVDFQSGFDTQVRAIAAGFNEQIGQHWMAGISAIYENGHLQWDQSGSAGTAQTFYGALYADYLTDRGHLGATFMAGYDDYDTARKIFIQSTNATAKSNSSGHEFIAHLTGSLEYDLKQTLLSPRLDLTYLYLQSNPFTENGAEGLNLSVASTTSQTLRGELGLSGQRKVAYEKGCAAFSLTGSWIVEKPLCRSQIEATFQGANIPFAVAGWNRTLMLFSPSADIHASYKWFGFGIRYKAEIGPRFFGQVGELRLDARW